VAGVTIATRIVKCADHRGIAPLEHVRNAAHAAPIGARWLQLDQHLVALHGAIDLIGRNKNVVYHLTDADLSVGAPGVGHTGSLPWVHRGGSSIRSHKAVAIAVQIEAAGNKVVAAAGRARNAPVLAIELGQVAADRQPGELLQQQAPLAPAAQAELAHKLLVSGLATWGA